ncbi:MAG: polysaccharide deacetylase family protein, partial [Oscillospiraceae bacterium]
MCDIIIETAKYLKFECRNLTSPWGNEDTENLIEILAKYNVKATFFVVGDWVDKYPESVK